MTNTTTTTAATKHNGYKIFPGFVYKDLITGQKVVVQEVKDGVITFDNGLSVPNLDAFELLDGTINYDLLGKESLLVKDGNLYIGDVEIETGTLYVEEVLHYQAPRVILHVRAGNSGKKKLFVYNVIDDKFFAVDESLFDEILDVKKYENVLIARLKNIEQTILKESDVEAAELDPDDLKLAVQTEDGYSFKVDTEKFVLFKDGFFVEAATFVLSEKSEIKEVKNNFLFIQEVNKEMISIDAPDGFIDVTVDGPSLVREVIISFAKILLEDGTEEIVDVYRKGSTVSIPDGEVVENIRVTNDENHSLLIETNEGFIYSNNYRSPRHAKGSVAKSVIADYPYFVSLEPGTHRNVFTLANEKYEVVKLEVVKTNDRGFTTNVIE